MPFIIVNLSSKLESYRESNGRQESAVCVVSLGELQRCPGVFSWDCCLCTVDSGAVKAKSRCN